jgi:hypothetical protein
MNERIGISYIRLGIWKARGLRKAGGRGSYRLCMDEDNAIHMQGYIEVHRKSFELQVVKYK